MWVFVVQKLTFNYDNTSFFQNKTKIHLLAVKEEQKSNADLRWEIVYLVNRLWDNRLIGWSIFLGFLCNVFILYIIFNQKIAYTLPNL